VYKWYVYSHFYNVKIARRRKGIKGVQTIIYRKSIGYIQILERLLGRLEAHLGIKAARHLGHKLLRLAAWNLQIYCECQVRNTKITPSSTASHMIASRALIDSRRQRSI